jgi:hypothetical protein
LAHGVRAWRDLRTDLDQVQVHRLRIGLRQHKGSALVVRGADSAEDVGPFAALVARGR